MVAIIDLINNLLTPIFDLICWPFRALPPIWAMTMISLLSGVVMVWVFGKVSNQTVIKNRREQIRGNLIGVRLFQNDIGVVMRLQRRIFGDTLQYMKHALVPMVVLLVPVLLVMTQLNLRFAVRPLEPGEPTVVKAFVRDPTILNRAVALDTGDGVTVETAAVRIPSTREMAWRVRADTSGEHELTVRVGEEALTTRLIAGDRWGTVPQRRTGRGALETLLYPGEAPIPAAHLLESVEIVYPALELRVLGWTVHWLVAFFVLSIVFGFALQGCFGRRGVTASGTRQVRAASAKDGTEFHLTEAGTPD